MVTLTGFTVLQLDFEGAVALTGLTLLKLAFERLGQVWFALAWLAFEGLDLGGLLLGEVRRGRVLEHLGAGIARREATGLEVDAHSDAMDAAALENVVKSDDLDVIVLVRHGGSSDVLDGTVLERHGSSDALEARRRFFFSLPPDLVPVPPIRTTLGAAEEHAQRTKALWTWPGQHIRMFHTWCGLSASPARGCA